MDAKQNKDRPLILVGPDGRALRLQEAYQDPRKWDTLETEDAVLMVARPGVSGRSAGLLEKVAAYVDEHLSERITLKDVAGHCGVSVSTLTQMFQKKTGTTFHTYLTQRRIQAAEHLIRSGVPLEETGRRVGYRDHSSFYRSFKRAFGVSPRRYRKGTEPE